MKAVILFVAAALAAAPALAQPAAQKTAEPKTARKEATITATAVVDAINYKTREITLDTKKGKVTVVADPEIKRLEEIKKGDTIAVTYHQGLLAEVRPPTAEEKANPLSTGAAGSVGGEKPAAAIGQQIKAVTTVVAIDKAKSEVTFKGPRGNLEIVTVEDPKNLEKVKVGDTVVFTYTEAIAIAVKPASQPKK